MAARPGYESRRRKLINGLRSEGLDALLVSNVTNVRYLTGFTGDSTWLLLSPRQTVLISDTRYTTQLANECPDVDTVIRDAGSTMNASVARVVGRTSKVRLGFDADDLTVAQYQGLESTLAEDSLVPTSGLVETLRQVKDKWELQQIREAIRIAERGIAVVRASLRSEQTEREIRYLLEEAMRGFGASDTAFEPIVGVGPTGALPHAHAGDLTVQTSPALLIDWGATTASGYRSDLTRCFFTSSPQKKMQTVYEVVLAAQQAAIAAIKPGAVCREIDAIARGMIADAGFGKYFGHGLGHGIGLDIHESVRLSPISDQVLEPGMVVTVEPGIYLPGRFGVRIEDDILVTREGHEVLTSVPRDFESARIENLA
jgi:Xaa-Pro aminopeptidase